MAQSFSLIHKKSMAERRGELKQAYSASKNMIAEKYLQFFLLQIGVPKFETRGWLSKTDKYYTEISDVLLEQEQWDEIVELIIGMEWWPIGHKFPAIGHVYRTHVAHGYTSEGRRRLRLFDLIRPFDSKFRPVHVKKGDYYMLHEGHSFKLGYCLSLFSVDGRLKKVMDTNGRAKLCFNRDLEGVLYGDGLSDGTLLVTERTNRDNKILYEGRKPDI